jgi:succinate dehydrogenase/fumarate reductase flavoprotein subunit
VALDDEAVELRRAAARLEACAGELPGELRLVGDHLDTPVWQGRAAGEAREGWAAQQERSADVADRLEERAAELRRRAEDMESDADQLRRQVSRLLAEQEA